MSKLCPNCHTELANDAQYCTKCGTKLELQMENITNNTNDIEIINNNPTEKYELKNTKQSEKKNPGSPMIMVLALIIAFAIVGCCVYFISTYFQNDKSESTQEVAASAQQVEVTDAAIETVHIALNMPDSYQAEKDAIYLFAEIGCITSDEEYNDTTPTILQNKKVYGITGDESFWQIEFLTYLDDSDNLDGEIIDILGHQDNIITHKYESIKFSELTDTENLVMCAKDSSYNIEEYLSNNENLNELVNYTPYIVKDSNLTNMLKENNMDLQVYWLKWKCSDCYYVTRVISHETVTDNNWQQAKHIFSDCYYRDKEQIEQLKNELTQQETYNESNYSENYNYSGSDSFSLDEIAGYYIGCGSNTGLEIYADGYIDGSIQSSETRSQWYSFSTSTCECYLQQIDSNTFVFNDQYGTELKLNVYYTEYGLNIDAYVDDVFVTTMEYNGTV